MMLWPNMHHSLLIHDISRSNTTHHSQYDTSGRAISLSQRLLLDNTQHSLQISIHTPSRIQTHNLSRQMARNPRLRTCSHQDRQYKLYPKFFTSSQQRTRKRFSLLPKHTRALSLSLSLPPMKLIRDKGPQHEADHSVHHSTKIKTMDSYLRCPYTS
jgi:hypothetical protein